MTIAPVNTLSDILHLVQATLAELDAMRERCDLEGLTPSEQIFWHSLQPESQGDVVRPAELKRPFILLRASGYSLLPHSVGCMQPQGLITLHVNDKNTETDFQQGAIAFSNFVGGVIDELGAKFLADEGYFFRSIDLLVSPTSVPRPRRTLKYDFWYAEIGLSLGVDFAGVS